MYSLKEATPKVRCDDVCERVASRGDAVNAWLLSLKNPTVKVHNARRRTILSLHPMAIYSTGNDKVERLNANNTNDGFIGLMSRS